MKLSVTQGLVVSDVRYFMCTMVRYTRACRRKFRKKNLLYLVFAVAVIVILHLEFRGSWTTDTLENNVDSLPQTIHYTANISSPDVRNAVVVVNNDSSEVQNKYVVANSSVAFSKYNILGIEVTRPIDSENTTTRIKAVVPNIVHLIWLGKDKQMTFLNYISIFSIYKHHHPIAIVLHYNHLPIGYWFDKLKNMVSNLKTRFYKPTTLFADGKPTNQIGDQITMMALEVLIKHGGIYMENDVIVLRKLEPLRHHIVTVGESKTRTRISAAFIAAEPNATFIRKWYESFLNDYRPSHEGYNRIVFPRRLCDRYPSLVHMDKWRLTTPDSSGHARLLQKNLNWDSLFIFHLMSRTFSYSFFTPDWIKMQNNTLAEVARLVHYGSTDFVTA